MNMPGAPLVCHVLLIETDDGLVLVDSGFGIRDCARPRRPGPARFVTRPVLSRDETAVARIEALGFRAEDVRHIVITHFDLDHIGGIADFPDARVHVTEAEARGAMTSPSRLEGIRYRNAQWAHGPKIVEHSPTARGGEASRRPRNSTPLRRASCWYRCPAIPAATPRDLPVDAGHRWILHCGDAFYHYGTLDGQTHVPRPLATQENVIAFNRKQVHDNHARLSELYHPR